MINFPRKIRAKRNSLSETQSQFGMRFRVSHAAVSDWESGKSQAPYEVLAFCFKSDIDQKIIDYIERSSVICKQYVSLNYGDPEHISSDLDRIVEVAKMLQNEELSQTEIISAEYKLPKILNLEGTNQNE